MMFDLFFRNRRLLVLVVALILVAGLSAFESLPRMEDPELVSRDAIVTTILPGADAERVEALVSQEIEDELFDIEEIKTLESTSRAGISIIEIELHGSVTDVDEVWSRVRDRLVDVTDLLPSDAHQPELEELEVRGYALIATLTWDHIDEVSYALLRRLAEGLEDELRGIKGTEQVELFGDPQEEVTVLVSPSRLAAMGLSVADVSQQIGRSDAKMAAGMMRGGATGNVLIEVEGEIDSLDRIGRTPVRVAGAGRITTLGDIATITKGIQRPASDLALVSGNPAVAVAAYVDSRYRIDHWAAEARETARRFSDNLPPGIELQVVFDQSRYTEQRLHALLTNLAFGALAVVVVTMVMMGWRSAVIVSASLPLSSLMVLAGMHALSIPMHQMSVTGLIIALGLLIDNAIVVVDEVRERMHQDRDASQAIRATIRHLAIPLLGSTMTTALAFAPIALMPGSVGEFVGTIAVSVILALGSSLFLALTVIPALTGILGTWGRPSSHAHSHDLHPSLAKSSDLPSHADRWWQEGVSIGWLTDLYASVLDRLIARPGLGVAAALALPIAGYVSATQLIEQFFPPTGRDMFQIELELPTQASLDQSRETAVRAREIMMSDPQVRDVHWFLGKSAPSFYYNLVSDQQDAAHYAQGIVQLNSSRDSVALIRQLQDRLDEHFPEARMLVKQLEQGPPFDAPIELRLYGPNLDRLSDLGDQARQILAGLPDVLHTDADLTEAQPKLQLEVDEEETRLAGLDLASIAQQLDQTLEGAVNGSLLESTEELPIRVRLSGPDRGDLSRISSLDLVPALTTSESQMRYIPMSALGELQWVSQRARVARRGGRRVNVVRGYVTAGVLPGKVLADYRRELERQFRLPPGYHMEFGGEFAERNDAVGNLSSSIGVLVVLMTATLVLSFSSFRLAMIIGVVAAMSGGLGLGALWMGGYPFGFMAIVGTMGLVGIAINDSIVVLAALREDERARHGDTSAIRDVIVRSSRHVLTTTLTTVAGFLPLIWEGGGFWPPLAITIAGGVLGATLLALLFVPAAFKITCTAQTVREELPAKPNPGPLQPVGQLASA